MVMSFADLQKIRKNSLNCFEKGLKYLEKKLFFVGLSFFIISFSTTVQKIGKILRANLSYGETNRLTGKKATLHRASTL